MEISFRIEVLILIAIILVILFGNTFMSCMSKSASSTKEGFSGMYKMNMDANQQASFSLTDNTPINTSSWFTPSLEYNHSLISELAK